MKTWQLLPCVALGLGLACVGLLRFADAATSTGYRDGRVQKFSRTGILWKTFEGEMGLAGFRASRKGDGATSNVWYFTVADPAVAVGGQHAALRDEGGGAAEVGSAPVFDP